MRFLDTLLLRSCYYFFSSEVRKMIDQIKNFIGITTNDYDPLIITLAGVFMIFGVKTLISIFFYPFRKD